MAVTQPLTAVKRGNSQVDTTMDWSTPGSRTQNQHEGVLAHFRRHPAAFIAGFDPFAGSRGAFAVTYVDLDGHHCSFWIRKDGRIEGFSYDDTSEVMAAEALLVTTKYGLFRGGE